MRSILLFILLTLPLMRATAQFYQVDTTDNIYTNDQVIIGEDMDVSSYGQSLIVEGGIMAEKVVVKTEANWPDYVFDKDYALADLDSLQRFIAKHKHLPGMITEGEVREQGVATGALQARLLEKIEELTLYLIEEERKIARLEQQIQKLKSK